MIFGVTHSYSLSQWFPCEGIRRGGPVLGVHGNAGLAEVDRTAALQVHKERGTDKKRERECKRRRLRGRKTYWYVSTVLQI